MCVVYVACVVVVFPAAYVAGSVGLVVCGRQLVVCHFAAVVRAHHLSRIQRYSFEYSRVECSIVECSTYIHTHNKHRSTYIYSTCHV